jgi:diguanylate cyclase (GGDEF)-like protein
MDQVRGATDAKETSDAANADLLRGMRHLLDVIQHLSLARDLPAIQNIVRSAARELTGADGATFVLREGGECFYADEDAIAPLWKGRRFPMEACVSGWVIQNRRPAAIEDIYTDPRIPAGAYRPTFVKSLAMVPIRTINPIGAIGNYWARPHSPTANQLDLLQALADCTAVAMETANLLGELEDHVRQRTRELEAAYVEIRKLSLVDDLTGLLNRRGFFVLADQARKTAARANSRFFILFADADGLKQVNDSLGHGAGDDMLRSFADILLRTYREADIIARLGGDEFCVFGIHEDTDLAAIKARLDRSMAAFNAERTRPFQISASVGVLSLPATDQASLDELISCADQAMYADKRARRRAR